MRLCNAPAGSVPRRQLTFHGREWRLVVRHRHQATISEKTFTLCECECRPASVCFWVCPNNHMLCVCVYICKISLNTMCATALMVNTLREAVCSCVLIYVVDMCVSERLRTWSPVMFPSMQRVVAQSMQTVDSLRQNTPRRHEWFYSRAIRTLAIQGPTKGKLNTSQRHWHSGLPVTEKWHVSQNYIMRQEWLMALNRIRGFVWACYSLPISIMLWWNGYRGKHALSFLSPNVFLFVGPVTGSPGLSQPAHASCCVWADLMDKTIYWLSNTIHAVHLRTLRHFISLLSSLFLWRNLTPSLSLFPSLACLQVVCCSQYGAGVQSLQISAAHGTVLLGTFQKWSNTRWSHPQWLQLLSITGVTSSASFL